MKKLLSINCPDSAFNSAAFLLRIGFGVLMMHHGYDKLVKFAEMKSHFMNFMGLGSTTSLLLVVFAEFFCAMFVVLGLFTRVATLPLIITMAVALGKAHNWDFLGEGANAALFLCGFLTILLLGPGKASVDGIAGN